MTDPTKTPLFRVVLVRSCQQGGVSLVRDKPLPLILKYYTLAHDFWHGELNLLAFYILFIYLFL